MPSHPQYDDAALLTTDEKPSRRIILRCLINMSPLQDSSLLTNNIFPYLKGEYLFIGSVNHTFRRAYDDAWEHDPCAKCTAIAQSVACSSYSCLDFAIDACKIKHGDPGKEELIGMMCSSAIEQGKLDVLQYLVAKHNATLGGWLPGIAAESGQFEVLQWLYANGCQFGSFWDDLTIANAAKAGNLAILQWLRQNKCGWNALVCEYAAQNGDQEMLQWAHLNGCPWDEGTCEEAAANGHMEILQWARQNNCPWNNKTLLAADSNGHRDILEWAIFNNCPVDWNNPPPIFMAWPRELKRKYVQMRVG